MLRGLYLANTGMLTQQRRMDVVTNNLANASTVGFRQDDLLPRSFAAELVSRLDDPALAGPAVGSLDHGIHVDEVVTDFSAGPVEETGLPTDLALTGPAFFAVQTPAGERYTRAGNFKVTADGLLTTQDGYPVLAENGPAQVGSADFTVSSTGRIQSAAGETQLRLVQFADPTGLRKEGNNLFLNLNAGAPDGQATAGVRQGCLEGSNVDLASQMTRMVEIYRSHEINQRMIKIFDEKLGRSVNDIGRI
jgi:flagellar basal-body rod protein FlgG